MEKRSKTINAINELPKQKNFTFMKEVEEENGYLLIDIDYWNEPDCLLRLDEVKYEDPKCIQCHINGCNIISHECMNRWYQENALSYATIIYQKYQIFISHKIQNIARK